MKNSTLRRILIALAIPVAYALLLRLLFNIQSWRELFSVMSISFLFLLPFIVGVLAVYFSPEEKARKTAWKVCFPWVPVFFFFIITLLVALEGWACWLMVLPLFLIAASFGGLLGGYLKTRKSRSRLQVSFLVFMPFLMAPVESLVGKIPGTYEAYTCIDIHAKPEVIWNNLTRVKEIPAMQDKGWLTRSLGFPRPVKAELNYLGVGAYREAVFTNGLVFHETVTAYEDQKKMVFTIRANPHDIPSTTMDEHVVIGGQFFDVLNGTYELEKLGEDTYRLHLYSHFKLTTTFNFYASWWAKWIMQDIQNNILQVEKRRSESP